MGISTQDVEHVARLARLHLSKEEVSEMAKQLDRIVGYIRRLEELDTSGVTPMAHAAEIANVFADDVPESSLDREAALGNAPGRDEECFRVPAVLGQQ